jgi:hypothetical protein
MTATRRTYTVTTRDGRTVTRRTEATYTHAAETERGRVTFHGTEEMAQRAAGRFGHVHVVGVPAARPAPDTDAWDVHTDTGAVVRYTGTPPAVMAAARADGHRVVKAERVR